MKEKGIKQIFSIASNPQSNSIVERFNGSFKRWLKKMGMLNDDIDQREVNQIVNNYNHNETMRCLLVKLAEPVNGSF
jgi:transposase InsO family protein